MDEKTSAVKITPAGKESLDRLYLRTGVIRVEIVGRMMEWLINQDRTLQAVILGQVDAQDESGILGLVKSRTEFKERSPPVAGDQTAVVALTQLLLGPATKAMSDVLEALGPEYLARVQVAEVVPAVVIASKVRRRKKIPDPSKTA